MNVSYVVEITHHVPIVQELQTDQQRLMSVAPVMRIALMTVFKIVLVLGVVIKN